MLGIPCRYVALLGSVLWTHKPAADEEDIEAPILSVLVAVVVLAIITALVTISSECALCLRPHTTSQIVA